MLLKINHKVGLVSGRNRMITYQFETADDIDCKETDQWLRDNNLKFIRVSPGETN